MAGEGKVFLVGAGPGDPGLLTLRGAECLRQADLVLYDGLVNPLLLRYTPASAERTCRVEGEHGRTLNQAEINRRLVEAAQAGKTVVRLKGGDPFIFGRGSEEAAALAEAGIPFEVVPGVSAAIAASAYAGISLTHRDWASAVAFITGHEDPAKPETALDYRALAAFPGTLVFYMGLHRLETIALALVAAGKPAHTPAAVICRGTTPAQRTVTAALAELPRVAQAAHLHAPSLIVVGDCVRQREQIHWFEDRPLFGLRIGITRPIGQCDREIARAFELGAQPVLLPTITIRPVADTAPLDEALERLADYDWLIFTSVNGVEAVMQRAWQLGRDARLFAQVKLAAIGPGTAQALEAFHLRADVVPETYRAEALAAALSRHVNGRRVLWARASRGRDVLPRELRAAGATIDELVVYQNEDVAEFAPELLRQIEAGELDWIALSSPSIARNLQRLLSASALKQLGQRTRLASISPVTSEAAREVGLPIAAEAEVHTWDGLFDAIIQGEQGATVA